MSIAMRLNIYIYIYHFNELPNFGAFFLNKLYVGIQKFIHSCALRKTNCLELKAIDFTSLLSSIDSHKINFICIPKCVKDTTKIKKTKQDVEEENESKKKRNQNKNKERVQNNKRDPQAKLAANQPFGEIFFKECREGQT